MSAIPAAFMKFETAYSEMLKAAEGVRSAIAAEAGMKREQPCRAIIEVVARFYDFPPEEITSARRTRDLADARHVAMWLCRALTRYSLQTIGREFGGRDHGTVIGAIRNVGDRAGTDPKFASELLDLRHRCEAELKP